MVELKKNQQQPSQSRIEQEEIGKNGEEMETVRPSQPIINPVHKTVKVIKDVPFIDRSVKPSLNSYNDYSYQEEQEVFFFNFPKSQIAKISFFTGVCSHRVEKPWQYLLYEQHSTVFVQYLEA